MDLFYFAECPECGEADAVEHIDTIFETEYETCELYQCVCGCTFQDVLTKEEGEGE
jgi:hypothetical protein